jgi:hypothetical protein
MTIVRSIGAAHHSVRFASTPPHSRRGKKRSGMQMLQIAVATFPALIDVAYFHTIIFPLLIEEG